MGERSDPVQEQKIQHESIAKHNAWIGGGMQENVDERNNEGEWNGRKKKRRIIGDPVSQVEGQPQPQRNGPQFHQGQTQSMANGQQKVIKGKINKKKSIEQKEKGTKQKKNKKIKKTINQIPRIVINIDAFDR